MQEYLHINKVELNLSFLIYISGYFSESLEKYTVSGKNGPP